MKFEVLGRSLELENLPAQLQAGLQSLWHFPEYSGILQSNFEISYALGLPIGPWPNQKPVAVELMSQHFDLYPQDPKFWYGDPTVGSHLELSPQAARIVTWGTADATHLAVASVGLNESLSASGLVPLHASIALKDGEGVAFLGPSGTGKSTTLIRAMMAGYIPVAEDFSWLEPSSMRLFGFDRGLRMLPDTYALLHRWKAVEATPHPDGKQFVAYEQLGFNRQAVTLSKLVVLKRDPHSPSRWEGLSKSEAALALWIATGLPFSKAARHTLNAGIQQMVQRLRLERLVLGQGLLPL